MARGGLPYPVGELLVGRGDPVLGRDPDPGRWVADWPRLALGARHRGAVEHALASDVLFLCGRPGPGRTDVVGHIVEGCFRQGLHVLLLAPTGIAVDRALERVCDLLRTENGFAYGRVQRAGGIELPSLEARYGDRVDIPRITDRVAARLDEALPPAAAALAAVRAELALHDEARALEARLDRAGEAHGEAAARAGVADGEKTEAELVAAEIRLRIGQSGSTAALFARRQEARLGELRDKLGAAEERVAGAARRGREARHLMRQVSALLDEVGGLAAAAREKLADVEPRPVLAGRADSLQQRLDRLEGRRRDLDGTVRAGCRVMGATVQEALRPGKLLDRVDVVVLDGAESVDLPSARLAAGLAGQRLVVVGELPQRPPDEGGMGPGTAGRRCGRAGRRATGAGDVFRAAGLVAADGTLRPDPRAMALDP